ncbi:hypothetical protein MTO96_051674 [Rhipicephalus appendiculatus]
MEATRDWIGAIASHLTIATFVGSLSISWRICRARSSSSVAFWPLISVIVCALIWLRYGRATGDARVALASACGLILMTVNATMHRVFAPHSGPVLPLVAALMLVYMTSSMMGAKQLGQLAFILSVAYHLAPIPAIAILPRMEISLGKIAIFGLWTVYAGLAGDDPLYASSLIGFVAGIAEVAFRSQMLLPDSFRRELQ